MTSAVAAANRGSIVIFASESGAVRYAQGALCAVQPPAGTRTSGKLPQTQALLRSQVGVPNRLSRAISVGQPIERSHPTPAMPRPEALLYSSDRVGALGPSGTGIGMLVV